MAQAYWRLYYADGSFIDEPESEGTILDSRPHPVILCVCREVAPGVRQPYVRVDLIDEQPSDGPPWMPIFYRNKSMDVRGASTGGLVLGEARTDLIVFGKGRTVESKAQLRKMRQENRGEAHVDTELFSTDGVNVRACPKAAIRQGAIDHLLFAGV